MENSTFKKNKKIVIFSICLVCFCANTLIVGQTCGTPDIPTKQMLEKRSKIIGSNADLIFSGLPPRIPVWIYILQDDAGNGLNETEAQIAAINDFQYFRGIFEFSICGTTTIQNNTFSSISQILGAPNDFNNLCDFINDLPETDDDNCVKLFYCDCAPRGYAPGLAGQDFDHSGVTINTYEPTWLAHEMGHYFGLLHTFQGGKASQFVSDDPIICLNSGDLICDTPADPSCNQIGCTPTCSAPNNVDPLGIPYNPDPTLLMSYYGDCRSRFSGEQSVTMRSFYSNDADYSRLNDPNGPCKVKNGQVAAYCLDQSTYLPMENIDITMIHNGGGSLCITTSDLSGKFQIDPANCSLAQGLRSTFPQKDDPDLFILQPLNGVTTFDLFLLQKHILGIEALGDPYKMIAADANNSGTITTFDVVTIRKVILGIESNYPTGSWRYVPDLWHFLPEFEYEFFDPGGLLNPFDVTVPYPHNGTIVNFGAGNNTVPNNLSWMEYIKMALLHESPAPPGNPLPA